ncbi:hypothetical protein G6011_03547 [Alternaria panax]|uniref:F-box domain-containing protein n=1 Tax=Alternaria panax TaxID=48097 RepID=A0AAD4IEW5_9PLEO|nr:hypothetical protein G6011_03547 [Alternaria panax]
MNIHTIHDLSTRSPTPPCNSLQTSRVTDAEPRFARFSVTDAVHLKLKLQALDRAVSSMDPEKRDQADMASVTSACQTRPFEEAVYVAGSEEFYLVVKGLPRPHLVADVYAEAYKNVLQGRPYVNNYNLSGCRGIDCVFSDVRTVLGDVDRVCATNLQGAFAKLEERGRSHTIQPFPFLRLPAELRLHVYSFLLPPERRIVLRPRSQDVKRPRLNIMRASRQLHDEVTKYFYKNWRLYVRVDSSPLGQLRQGEVCYQGVRPTINSATLELLKELEIRVYDHLVYLTGPPSSRISYIFGTFKLERVRITFELSKTFGGHIKDPKMELFCRRLIDQIPASADDCQFLSHISQNYLITRHGMDDKRLEQVFSSLPYRCVVLIEDIDCAGAQVSRGVQISSKAESSDNHEEDSIEVTTVNDLIGQHFDEYEQRQRQRHNMLLKLLTNIAQQQSWAPKPVIPTLPKKVTFSGLLNVIDRATAAEGRLLV